MAKENLNNKKMRVLYAQAVYGDEEKKAVLNSLENTFLSVGNLSKKFENQIAKLFNKKYGVFVNSGSSANLLVTQLIPKGEVITPALTFATTLTPLLQCGLTPVFIDSGIDIFLPTVEDIEAKITKKTTAVMIPNLLGNKIDSLRLRKLCDKKGILYIEDSCDTITQSNGHFVTTSFYGSHIITAMGSGGMVMSDDKKAIERIRTMRDWGRGVDVSEKISDRFKYKIDEIPYDGKFVYVERGFNMRPVEAQAAFGLEQLKRLPEFAKKRKENFQKLYDFFKDYPYFNLPKSQFDPNWLAFPLTLKNATFQRFELVKWFEDNGIQTRPIFSGNVLRHSAFRDLKKGEFPNADYIMEHGILLGIHQGMNDAQLNHIKETFKEFAKSHTMDILMTGSRGRLGTEMKKHLHVIEFKDDITKEFNKTKADLVIHAAAYTDTTKAEKEPDLCFKTNVEGTYNMVKKYKDVPFVYISTEYAKNPLGVYATTKFLGEEIVKTHPKHLIIRTLFKPRPWPFPMAYKDQYTQGDYTDVIAKLIADKIKNWDKKTSELCYIGTGRKTMLDLARKTKPDTMPNTVADYVKKTGAPIPKDYL